MTMFLLSLDEIDRVKRLNQIHSTVDLANRTHVSRNTWASALRTRRPTPAVLDALADLGARPNRILVTSTADVTAA